MRTTIATLVSLALLGLGPACSGGDGGPTTIELPIESLRIMNKGSCGAVVEGAICPLQVEARTAEGQVIINPIVRWSSTNSAVAQVSEEGVVTARSGGDATVRVSNTTDTASDQTLIRVLFSNPK